MKTKLASTIAACATALAFSALLQDSVFAKGPSAWDGRAPSFSCRGTLSPIEGMICADAKASQSDYFLEMTYRQTRPWVSSEQWKSLAAEQRQWIVERDRCKETACLIAKIRERSARLSEIQREGADAVRERFSDERFTETAVSAGIESLRKKYGVEIDRYGEGTLTSDSFACSPSAYQRATCITALGPSGTCDDGSRSGDSASFDVLTLGGSRFEIVNVAGYEACSGTPFASTPRRPAH